MTKLSWSEMIYRVNHFYEENRRDLFISAVIFFIGLIGFGLGRLSAIVPEKAPLVVKNSEPFQNHPSKSEEGSACTEEDACSPTSQEIMASKNGSTYYFPWCTNSIKEENKIFFQSESEAEKTGYRLAKNCKK